VPVRLHLRAESCRAAARPGDPTRAFRPGWRRKLGRRPGVACVCVGDRGREEGPPAPRV